MHQTLTDRTEPAPHETPIDRPQATLGFAWRVIGAALWLIGGLYLDGWAHHHLETSLETFFTPWHGVFYTGFLVMLGVLSAPLLRDRTSGRAWLARIPQGYSLAVVGAALFLAGGAGDMLWHELVGIEADVEALISPTHLLIAIGMGLMVTGPYRAALRQAPPRAGWATLPAVLSLAILLALLTFFTQFVHPLAEPWTMAPFPKYTTVPGPVRQELGTAGILVSAALLAGSLATLLRLPQHLPPGSITILLALPALALATQQDQYRFLPGILLVGIIADGAWWGLPSAADRRWARRLLVAGTPVLVAASIFGTLLTQGHLSWSLHMWGGNLVLAGIVGWLLSQALDSAPLQQTTAARP